MSTSPTRKRPSNSPDTVSASWASWALSGDRVREKNTSSTGAVIDASTVAWKFCSVDRHGVRRAGRSPPGCAAGRRAGGEPAAGSAGGRRGRWRRDG